MTDRFTFIEKMLHETMLMSSGLKLSEGDKAIVLGLMEQAAKVGRESAPGAAKKRSPSKVTDEDTTPVVLELPLRGGEKWAVRQSHVDKLRAAYPQVNTKSMLLKISLWCDANTDKRPISNMYRFITTWFGAEQQRQDQRQAFTAGRGQEPAKNYKPSIGEDPELIAEMKRRREENARKSNSETRPTSTGAVITKLFGDKK